MTETTWQKTATALILGAAVLGSAGVLARAGVESFRIKHAEKRITVTGSATRRIRSDLVVWRSGVKSQAPEMAQAYRKLAADVPALVAFIKAHGIEEKEIKTKPPVFQVGDAVKIHVRVREGEKDRIQVFQGTVIAKKGGGIGSTFTVRKVSDGIGVERIFPLYSPIIGKIEVVRQGRVRRAKLYYLRNRRGKAARIEEKVQG